MFRRTVTPLGPPKFSWVPAPDTKSKWANKHIHEVIAVMERMQAACESDPTIRVNALILADAWLGSIPEPVRPQTAEALAALTIAAQNGLALASLDPLGAPMPREIYEALDWVAFVLMPEEAKSFSSAAIFAVHAGHYVGREKTVSAREYVVDVFDWIDALSTSARAAVSPRA